MKILLAKRRALGDTVLLSSSVDLLAHAIPGAEITALVPAGFAPVLEGHPHLKALWTFEEGGISLLRRVRAERFDHFFQLHASPGTRWFGWASGAKEVHFHRQNNVTEKAYGKHPNALEWDGFFFRTVFGEKVQLPAPAPRICLSDEERAKGKSFWRERGVEHDRVIFLGLGASRPPKRWWPSHFARLAELLRDRRELLPAIVVGPGEQEAHFAGAVIDELRVRGFRPGPAAKGEPFFLHLAGLSVRQLAVALSAVKAYVGNDSGPKHMAAAVGIPTFTLFGPEDPVEWHPYSRERHPVFFLPGLDCRREDQGRWCGVPVCDPAGPQKHRCMRDLDPVDVFQAMEKFL